MIKVLDFYRVLGTLMIFLCHIPFIPANKLGMIGLELFFVLSGFTIYLGYGNKSLKFSPFFKKRLIKIYPVYIITTLLGLVYMVFVLGYEPLLTLLKLIPHALCIQTLFPIGGLPTAFNGAAWYIATLLFCYLGFFFFNKCHRKAVFFVCYWILYFTLFINIDNHNFQYFSPFCRFADFFIGVFFAWLYKKYQLHSSTTSFTIIELLLILMIAAYYVMRDVMSLDRLLLCVLLGLVYYVSSFEKGLISKCLNNKLIIFLAKYSLYFYLVHYLIIQTFIQYVHLEIGFTYVNILCILFLFGMSGITAFLLRAADKKIQSRLNT